MSLIKCPECSSEVSDTATRCLNCGLRLIKPKRSGFGKFVKWVFILFNILMIVWLIAGFSNATEGYSRMSEARQAGTAIGTTIGVGLILGIWAAGDIILGMFVFCTRPNA